MTGKTIASALVCAVGLTSFVGVGADVRATKRDAASLKQKVAAITAHGETASRVARRTIVTENEVNSYLVYEAGEQIPVGVV